MKFLALLLFISTVPTANWLIGNVGTTCLENGPCVIPVGFGLSAPSGVLLVGVALALRDFIQAKFGGLVSIAAILMGALLSWWVASPYLALASASAFLASELMDLAVFSRLRQRNLYLAIFASGTVGALVDSAVFLWVAFGSFEFIAGQIIGKMWMTLAAVAMVMTSRWIISKRSY